MGAKRQQASKAMFCNDKPIISAEGFANFMRENPNFKQVEKEVTARPKGCKAIMPGGFYVPEEKGFYPNSSRLNRKNGNLTLEHNPYNYYLNRKARRLNNTRPPVPKCIAGVQRVQLIRGAKDEYGRPLRIVHEL